MSESLASRLRKRAEIRRQIPSRKSVQNGEPDRLADLLDEAADALERAERRLLARDSDLEENLRLRAALAHSDRACVYCTLPAEDFAKCQYGFPGCARADDMLGCPHLSAAFEVAELKAEIERLQKTYSDASWRANSDRQGGA